MHAAVACVIQRLCEELEYSELLDRVIEINDPFDRMVVFHFFVFRIYWKTAVWSYRPKNVQLPD